MIIFIKNIYYHFNYYTSIFLKHLYRTSIRKLYFLLYINGILDVLKCDKWNRSCLEIRHSDTNIKKKYSHYSYYLNRVETTHQPHH